MSIVHFESDTVLISGPEDTPGHSLPQLVLRCRDQQTPDGAGGFIRWQGYTDAGVLRDTVAMNGGLVDATDGSESSVLDFALYREGSPEVSFHISAKNRVVGPGVADIYDCGSELYPYHDGWLAGALNTPIVRLKNDQDGDVELPTVANE